MEQLGIAVEQQLIETGEKSTFIVLYGVLLTVATLGNSSVTYFILVRRRLAEAYNCFMLSLTLADFSMLYFECVFKLIYLIDGYWGFGTIYCIINIFLSQLTTAVCSFTLTMISYIRYIAIVQPFEERANWKQALLKIMMTWAIALLVAIPTIFFSTQFAIRSSEGDEVIKCEVVWPEDNLLLNNYTYRIVMFIITYALPSIMMAYWNIRIGWVIKSSTAQLVGDRNQPQLQLLLKKRKHLVKAMWTMWVIFCLCWLPYQTYMIYQTFMSEKSLTVKRVSIVVYWLAVSSAAVNPLLFYFLDKEYHTYIRKKLINVQQWFIIDRM